MARQNCSGLCKPSLLQSFRLFLHDSFSWRSAFQGRDCPLGGTALKTLSVRIPRRLSPGGVGCRGQEIGEMPGKYGKSNGMPRSTARGRRGRGAARRLLWHSTCSYAQTIDPDNSGFKQQQLNLLEWGSPSHPSWFIKSGRVSFWFPELRSHLVLIGNSSTRVETEQINHLDHWSDAQANFARGAIDA